MEELYCQYGRTPGPRVNRAKTGDLTKLPTQL